jgi:glycosyltransferase involved in cell wall biosynthesis
MEPIRKEYKTLSKNAPNIGLLMMVKNEKKRIEVTLKSVVGFVDAIIIYDTGSTDNTIEIIQEFCEKHKINLYMKQGEFVNFAVSRNVSLDFADTVNVHYLLLLDCNDELRGGDNLLKYAKAMFDKDTTGFLMCQEWQSKQIDKYYNIRFVKNRCGWRYRGSVHEWMKDTSVETDQPKFPVERMSDNMVLFQDRNQDDDKTGKRFARDKVLLLKDHQENSKEPRTLFYLAQTCQCLQEIDEAFYYSKLRTELDGFEEERFHSYLRCGTCSVLLNHDWSDSMAWFLKAFEHSERVEPLVKISEYYKNNKKWHMAYMFCKRACELKYPNHAILFVDKTMYDYYRWHIMGICGYYVGDYAYGKIGCSKAIEVGLNKDVDTNNLKFYIEKEENAPKETRKNFIERVSRDLKEKNPKLTMQQIVKQANNMWKKKG